MFERPTMRTEDWVKTSEWRMAILFPVKQCFATHSEWERKREEMRERQKRKGELKWREKEKEKASSSRQQRNDRRHLALDGVKRNWQKCDTKHWWEKGQRRREERLTNQARVEKKKKKKKAIEFGVSKAVQELSWTIASRVLKLTLKVLGALISHMSRGHTDTQTHTHLFLVLYPNSRPSFESGVIQQVVPNEQTYQAAVLLSGLSVGAPFLLFFFSHWPEQ